jgi:hypothetical protein
MRKTTATRTTKRLDAMTQAEYLDEVEVARRAAGMPVSRRDFVISNRRSPNGNGTWYFRICKDGRQVEANGSGWIGNTFCFTGDFAEALQAAKMEAARLGANKVYVGR